MPWKEINVMNQRTEFVLKTLQNAVPFDQLCREYGISRKTGYKWKNRFFERGLDGLQDQSRKPDKSPNELDESVICRIVKLKLAHPHWGPNKIRAIFARQYPETEIPSTSSFKRVLDKAGLVEHRLRRRQQETGRIQNRTETTAPNQVWTVDFKGWWHTRDKKRFEPLTIRDDYSRYLLCAASLESSRTEIVQKEFEKVFERYGLPEIIRSDNGPPFAASNSPLGLSRLSAWWLACGIDLDRITPGRPCENGGHERMHRDMASELEMAASDNIVQQQAELDEWRRVFNEERPHEALNMRTPSELYEKSDREFSHEKTEIVYPDGYYVRKVTTGGTLRFKNVRINISTALCGWDVGLTLIRQQRYAVWFCNLCLGEIDLDSRSFSTSQAR